MHIRDAANHAIGLIQHDEPGKALIVLDDILNARFEDPQILYLMGTCHKMLGNNGIAYTLFLRALELQEDYFAAMVNMSSIMREEGRHDDEVTLLLECAKLQPDDPVVTYNLAGAYINNGTPEIAEGYARKFIEENEESPNIMIHLGLALLEQEKFGEGFDAWDKGLNTAGRKMRNFQALGQTPLWDGRAGQNVVVYGEQGHGDEIMFASCMDDVFKRCKQVIIDTSKPDLVPIYEKSFPKAIVLCTPKSDLQPVHMELQIDAMIPFGSLGTLFRRETKDFPAHNGYIKANTAKKKEMRRRLDGLGKGLKIGLAWRGGIKKTHSAYRNMSLEQFAPILMQDAHFVSVQYGPDAGGEAALQQDRSGVPVHHWQAAIDDFEMLTALIDELDLVISVPQTAVHQRAALGKECWTITHHKAPWTFGMTREDCIWYPKQVRQFRRQEDEDWSGPVLRCAQELSKRTGTVLPPEFQAPTRSAQFDALEARA